jgi:iron uptake system component EfeO
MRIVRTGFVAALAAVGTVALAVPAGAAKEQTVSVKLTSDGCPKAIRVKPGSITFKVSNVGADNVSEFEVLQGKKIVGEVENIAPGLQRSFTLKLKAGSYVTYCPGGDTREKSELTVAASNANQATTATTAAPGG